MRRVVGVVAMMSLSALAACGDGEDGRDGAGVLSAKFPEAPGANCRQGGNRIGFGTDTNRDGTLQEEEVTVSSYECNGDACVLRPYADCRNADLRALSLIGYISASNLNGIDLSGADLSYGLLADGVSLVGANLTGAKLDGVYIQEALLVGANLTNASMKNAYIDEASFDDAVLEGTDFSASRLREMSMVGARASGAKFLEATIEFDSGAMLDANLTAADFTGATFDTSRGAFAGANLSNANFTAAQFTQARFDEQDTSAKLTGANFSFATFFYTDISMLALADAGSFANAYFGGTSVPVDFDIAARGGVDVDTSVRTDYSNVDFSRAYFDGGPSLRGTTLTGASFKGTRLDTSLDNATANGVDFSGAYLLYTSLEGAKLQGAKFVDAYFEGVDVDTATDLSNADFTNARLNNNSFSGAKLDGAQMSHASVFDSNMAVQEPVAPINWAGAFANTNTTWLTTVPAGVVIVQSGTPLTSKELSGIWLADVGLNLTAADDWSGVNLTGARLYDERSGTAPITFTGANLAGANFTNAIVWQRSGGRIDPDEDPMWLNANLSGANFTGAQLYSVTFGGANLTNATFTDANLLCAFDGIGEGYPKPVTTGATWSGALCPDGRFADESCDNHRAYLVSIWTRFYCDFGAF